MNIALRWVVWGVWLIQGSESLYRVESRGRAWPLPLHACCGLCLPALQFRLLQFSSPTHSWVLGSAWLTLIITKAVLQHIFERKSMQIRYSLLFYLLLFLQGSYWVFGTYTVCRCAHAEAPILISVYCFTPPAKEIPADCLLTKLRKAILDLFVLHVIHRENDVQIARL